MTAWSGSHSSPMAAHPPAVKNTVASVVESALVPGTEQGLHRYLGTGEQREVFLVEVFILSE